MCELCRAVPILLREGSVAALTVSTLGRISSAEEKCMSRTNPSCGIACIGLTHREDADLTSNLDNSASHPHPRVHTAISSMVSPRAQECFPFSCLGEILREHFARQPPPQKLCTRKQLPPMDADPQIHGFG